jgi:hypothetical protein
MLFLNRETLTPFETAQVEYLIQQVQSLIENDIGYPIADFTEIPQGIEFVALNIVCDAFRTITQNRIGIASAGYNSLFIKYSETGTLPPSLDLLLQRHRVCAVA